MTQINVNPNLTHHCVKCDSDKPFPEYFIASYVTQKMSNECRDCRNLRKRISRKLSLGKTEEKSKWKHSISKFFKK